VTIRPPAGFSHYDIFLMRIDSLGNLELLKKYGGNEYEINPLVIELNDGNYLIAAETWEILRKGLWNFFS
jgi:hypothetical protein